MTTRIGCVFFKWVYCWVGIMYLKHKQATSAPWALAWGYTKAG